MCRYYKSHVTVNCSEKKINVNCCITVPSYAAEPEPKPGKNGGKLFHKDEHARITGINQLTHHQCKMRMMSLDHLEQEPVKCRLNTFLIQGKMFK
jgi:hypothetical protein